MASRIKIKEDTLKITTKQTNKQTINQKSKMEKGNGDILSDIVIG